MITSHQVSVPYSQTIVTNHQATVTSYQISHLSSIHSHQVISISNQATHLLLSQSVGIKSATSPSKFSQFDWLNKMLANFFYKELDNKTFSFLTSTASLLDHTTKIPTWFINNCLKIKAVTYVLWKESTILIYCSGLVIKTPGSKDTDPCKRYSKFLRLK